MESSYLQIFTTIATIFVVFFLISNHILKKNQIFVVPINWPLFGMLPHILLNIHRFHDWCTQLLKLHNGTFLFKGPWFSSMELLFTTDSSNVHYVMSKNFPNFPKGEEFSRIFDILGDGIFNVDFELWRYQRKVAHSFLTHPSFHLFLAKTVTDKVVKGLIPILDSGCKSGRVMDLEDLFQRFTFDTICTLVTGSDPSCLSVDDAFRPSVQDQEEAMRAPTEGAITRARAKKIANAVNIIIHRVHEREGLNDSSDENAFSLSSLQQRPKIAFNVRLLSTIR